MFPVIAAPPRATGTMTEQHGLLLVQLETLDALQGKLQHLEGVAVQVEKLASVSYGWQVPGLPTL